MARNRDDEDLDYGDVDSGLQKQQAMTVSRAYKHPQGVPAMKFESAAIYRVDIMPFRCGKFNPCREEGQIWWTRDYFVHNQVGPDRKSVCCLRKNWNERCAVCEFFSKQLQGLERGDKAGFKAVKEIDAKHRQLYALYNLESPVQKIHIADLSFATLGERLQAKLRMGNEKNGYKKFFFLKGGLTLALDFQKKAIENSAWYFCAGIEMEEREQDYPSSLLDKVPCLDDLPIKMDYDAVYSILHGVDAGGGQQDRPSGRRVVREESEDDDTPVATKRKIREEPEEEPEPAPKTRKKVEPDPEPDDDDDKNPAEAKGISKGDTVWHDECGRCEVQRVSPDGTSLTLYSEEKDETFRAISPEDVLVGEEAEEAFAKSKKKKAAGKTVKKPADEEPEGGDDWEDDKPKPRKK